MAKINTSGFQYFCNETKKTQYIYNICSSRLSRIYLEFIINQEEWRNWKSIIHNFKHRNIIINIYIYNLLTLTHLLEY